MKLSFTSNSARKCIGSVLGGGGGVCSFVAGNVPVGDIMPGQTYIRLNLWDVSVGASSFLLSEVTASGVLILSGHYKV